MKDAKGHGSDPRGAHSTGIENLGAPGDYQWSKYKIGDQFRHALVPSSDVIGSFANHGNAIARVEPFRDSAGKSRYKATLLTNFNTGAGRVNSFALHNTVVGAKKWVASRAANSWNPPNIK